MRNKKAMMAISIGAGAAAEGLTAAALWWLTKLPIQDVAMIALIAYVAAMSLALLTLDRRYNVRVSRKRYAKPQIYNLADYPEWREKGTQKKDA